MVENHAARPAASPPRREPDRRRALAVAGLNAAEEAAYELLVEKRTATVAQLAAVWTRPEPLGTTMATLEAKGLVSRSAVRGDEYTAAAPNIALEDMLLSLEQQLHESSSHVSKLAAVYAARAQGRPTTELVEVITGPRAVRQRLTQIQRSAGVDVSCLNKPPFFNQLDTVATALQNLARDVRYRTIYQRSSMDLPGSFQEIERLIAADGQVRVVATLPMALYIVDRRLALLPLQREDAAATAAIIVHPCGLLDALSELFDTLWQRALPLALSRSDKGTAAPSRDITVDDERLVALLLSGLTDQAIARQLGIGHRTVQRRAATLMEHVGARTRFQAGVQTALRRLREENDGAAGPADRT